MPSRVKRSLKKNVAKSFISLFTSESGNITAAAIITLIVLVTVHATAALIIYCVNAGGPRNAWEKFRESVRNMWEKCKESRRSMWEKCLTFFSKRKKFGRSNKVADLQTEVAKTAKDLGKKVVCYAFRELFADCLDCECGCDGSESELSDSSDDDNMEEYFDSMVDRVKHTFGKRRRQSNEKKTTTKKVKESDESKSMDCLQQSDQIIENLNDFMEDAGFTGDGDEGEDNENAAETTLNCLPIPLVITVNDGKELGEDDEDSERDDNDDNRIEEEISGGGHGDREEKENVGDIGEDEIRKTDIENTIKGRKKRKKKSKKRKRLRAEEQDDTRKLMSCLKICTQRFDDNSGLESEEEYDQAEEDSGHSQQEMQCKFWCIALSATNDGDKKELEKGKEVGVGEAEENCDSKDGVADNKKGKVLYETKTFKRNELRRRKRRSRHRMATRIVDRILDNTVKHDPVYFVTAIIDQVVASATKPSTRTIQI